VYSQYNKNVIIKNVKIKKELQKDPRMKNTNKSIPKYKKRKKEICGPVGKMIETLTSCHLHLLSKYSKDNNGGVLKSI
jgi:hypothetical protein